MKLNLEKHIVTMLVILRQIFMYLNNWKGAVLVIVLLAGCKSHIYYYGLPVMFTLRDPYSVLRFKHGHVNTLPTYMTSNESFHDDNNDSINNLLPAVVPLTVHIIWCEPKQFHFVNYLSILSAYRFLKPTRIIFHYFQKPELDIWGYYQYYGEMMRTIPILVEEPIERCVLDNEKKVLIFSILNQRGGIFIDENTILSSSLSSYRKFRLSYSSWRNHRLVMMAKGEFQVVPSIESIDRLLKTFPAIIKCIDVSNFKINQKPDCIIVVDQVYPKDIVLLDSEFGRLTRWIYYGSKQLLRPRLQNNLIPLIAHYVWLGKRSMKYFDYLSLLSAIHVLKVECVYIHGDVQPMGPYWKQVQRIPNVKFIFREFPTSVFGNNIVKYASHASDVLRSDLLIRYGGIYMDWDVIWVNPIPRYLRQYDSVFSLDWPSSGEFPDVFNMGVLLGKQGSKFLQFFLESYRHYLDDHWSYNAIWMPYKVYEQHPDLGYIDNHLQVICAEARCHPTWLPGYKQYHHLNKLKFDWRNETLSMHWTYPDPPEFESEEALLASNSMFGDIGKFVLKQAGFL